MCAPAPRNLWPRRAEAPAPRGGMSSPHMVTASVLGQRPAPGGCPVLGDASPHQAHQEQSSQCVPVRPGQRWGDEGPKMQKGAMATTQTWAPEVWMAHLMPPAQASSCRKALSRASQVPGTVQRLSACPQPLTAGLGRQMLGHRPSVASGGCRDARTRRWSRAQRAWQGGPGRVSCRRCSCAVWTEKTELTKERNGVAERRWSKWRGTTAWAQACK